MPLTTILATDLVTNSRVVINNNFVYLDTKLSGTGSNGIGTTSPIGKLQTVISAINPFIVGGATQGSYTIVTSPTANKDYLNKTGLGTASTVGNLVVITAGTGVTTGIYRITNIIGADSIQIDRVLHASGSDVTDISVSISVAPTLVSGTDGTYINRIQGNLIWTIDGGGNIGVAGGNNSPLEIYALSGVTANYITGGIAIITGATGAFSWSSKGSLFSSGIGIFSLTGMTNSYAGIATGSINGFAIQSAAGTSTFNDVVTAGSGVVAQRHIVFIDTPTLTATNASVTYTQTCALHLGLPAASTNVTFTNPAKSLLCDGPVDASKYYIGGVVGYNGTITLLGLTNITVAYGIITGAS